MAPTPRGSTMGYISWAVHFYCKQNWDLALYEFSCVIECHIVSFVLSSCVAIMEAVDSDHYLTPPETPVACTKEVPGSSSDEDQRSPPFFVRRGTRKRNATDFFFIPAPYTLEDIESVKRSKSRKEKLLSGSSSITKESARRSLVFSESTPQKSPLTSSPLQPMEIQPAVDLNTDRSCDIQGEYPIGSLVWAKLKGYDWWPGRVSSHAEVGMDLPPHGSAWIRWYGEKQVSDVSYLWPILCYFIVG